MLSDVRCAVTMTSSIPASAARALPADIDNSMAPSQAVDVRRWIIVLSPFLIFLPRFPQKAPLALLSVLRKKKDHTTTVVQLRSGGPFSRRSAESGYRLEEGRLSIRGPHGPVIGGRLTVARNCQAPPYGRLQLRHPPSACAPSLLRSSSAPADHDRPRSAETGRQRGTRPSPCPSC